MDQPARRVAYGSLNSECRCLKLVDTFRLAIDADTGREIWRTHMIPTEAEPTTTNSVGTQLWGPSGAAVWSAPTLDPERNRLFVTIGDSYSDPVAPASDAVMALAMDTGRILWIQQTLPGDAWNILCMVETPEDRVTCPDSEGPDYDFGSSAVLTTLENEQPVLLAGQKSGVLFAMNPEDGRVIWETRVGDGGVLGGIEWGFATDGRVAYVSLSSALEKGPGEAGGLAAVRVEDGEILWNVPPAEDTCGTRVACNTPQPGAVTAIPGIVFSGSLDGHLRAYDAETGAVIWDIDTAREFDTVNEVTASGGSINGPGATVVDGMLYVSSGYNLGFMPGNVLLAFSIE